MSCSSIESDTESPWCNKAWHLAAGSRPWRRARRGVRCSFDRPVVTITSSRCSYQAVSCGYPDGMRSGEVGIKLSGAFQCPFAIGCLKPSMLAFLHDTTSLDRQLHYTASISEHGQKGIVEAICRSPNARLVMCHFGVSHGCPPAQATPHVLHAWYAHECSIKIV